MPKPTKRDHLGGGNERATLGRGVCTENSILVAYMTESPNVSGDDRSLMLLPDPVRLCATPKAGEQAPAESQLTPVALTMRPAGLSSGIDQDREDYTVCCGMVVHVIGFPFIEGLGPGQSNFWKRQLAVSPS